MVDVADPRNRRSFPISSIPRIRPAIRPILQGRVPGAISEVRPLDHIGNVRDGVLFLAWYGMCARAINIQDPLHPVEAGRFTYQIDPSKPQFAGCDTYDIELGQNGLLYVSDGTSGLRVLKYTGGGQQTAGRR